MFPFTSKRPASQKRGEEVLFQDQQMKLSTVHVRTAGWGRALPSAAAMATA